MPDIGDIVQFTKDGEKLTGIITAVLTYDYQIQMPGGWYCTVVFKDVTKIENVWSLLKRFYKEK